MLTDKEVREKKKKATKVDLNTYGYKNGTDVDNWITSGISRVYMRNFGIRLLIKRTYELLVSILLFINFAILSFDNDLPIIGSILTVPIVITLGRLITTCIRFNAIRNREYKLIDISIKGASIDFTASDCNTAYFFDTEVGRIRALDSEELFKILNDKDKTRKYKNCTAICIGRKPYLAYLSTNEMFGEAPDKYGNTQEELEMAYGNKVTVIEVPETKALEIEDSQNDRNHNCL